MGDVVAMTEALSANYVELAAEIVSAYVSNNVVEANDIPALLHDVHSAIVKVTHQAPAPAAEPLKPAVSPRRSITSDYIICLEDGKKFKSLKRHLRSHYNLTPGQYREKWGLAADYPMVAPNYAEARSVLAKRLGLGQQRRRK